MGERETTGKSYTTGQGISRVSRERSGLAEALPIIITALLSACERDKKLFTAKVAKKDRQGQRRAKLP